MIKAGLRRLAASASFLFWCSAVRMTYQAGGYLVCPQGAFQNVSVTAQGLRATWSGQSHVGTLTATACNGWSTWDFSHVLNMYNVPDQAFVQTAVDNAVNQAITNLKTGQAGSGSFVCGVLDTQGQCVQWVPVQQTIASLEQMGIQPTDLNTAFGWGFGVVLIAAVGGWGAGVVSGFFRNLAKEL